MSDVHVLPRRAAAPREPSPVPGYAELQVTTNFSFLRGASHPHEYVARARELGLAAIGIADHESLAGIVRAHVAAKEAGLQLLVGSRLEPQGGPPLLCYPKDRQGYAILSRLISTGRRRAGHGQGCRLDLVELGELAGRAVVVALETDGLAGLIRLFARDTYLAASFRFRGDDHAEIARRAAVASAAGVRLVATNDVHAHVVQRRALQDVLTCIREGCTIDAAGYRLHANAERHLKTPAEMARLFARWPDALAATLDIAAACRFSLDELRYDYPDLPDAEPGSAQATLARLAREGAIRRYPGGVPDRIARQIAEELAIIADLGFAPYFLTVHDIMEFARSRGILCQGRGSAANSAVCYCIGITAVDPAHANLLFARFISAARDEPPDIDVDFEHERREEVIQYVYERYGRTRAGLAATVISFRMRSALREVGKVLGLGSDAIEALAGTVWGRSEKSVEEAHIAEAGLDPGEPRLRLALALTQDLMGFPRHLSQHVGGFVIARGRLDEICPVVDAAMDARTLVEWDKDDLDALGILKIDLLALGMLTCIRKAFDLVEGAGGPALNGLADIPQDDSAVYDMLCKADAIGVFQVESRAQMSMLPRLKPRVFYDLVIQVAIVRPGPIQGGMVHPYLRRRDGREKVEYPSPALEKVLGKTCGVPLFQEQAMSIAIVAAGFTPTEADALRRAMATFKRSGLIGKFQTKMIEGMVANGYARDFAERCFEQIKGFSTYGFPESHAASFALLAYVSAWLKCHHPAAFAAALLNSQPMGFYAPAQIVRDAQEHGVTACPPCVDASVWDCTLEDARTLRLGLRQINGLSQAAADALVAARPADGYRGPADLARRAHLGRRDLDALARADAFAACGLDRRPALWQAGVHDERTLPLFAHLSPVDARIELPAMTLGEAVAEDYAHLRLSLKAHPMALLRRHFPRELPCAGLRQAKNGARVTLAGIVLLRQRPGTAKGTIFVTIEDEDGVANLIVWPKIFEAHRAIVMGARLLRVEGQVQRQGDVIHVVARKFADCSALLGTLVDGTARLRETPPRTHYPSRDFH
ncbi:MAG: error-prone DNA polymerase [Rhodospirillales bacterium]|nr:error-prone DNA polymerase [Rhodospirillales bacterium]